MPKFKKGLPNPGKPRKAGVPNRQTREIKAVVQAVINYLGEPENLEALLDDVRKKKPEVLVAFLARIAPRELSITSQAEPFVVIQIPEMRPDA